MAIVGGLYAAAAAAVADPATFARAQAAWKNQAIAVYNEGPGVTNHAVRAAFATKVVNGTVSWMDLVGAVTAQGVTSASTDANIDTAIASIWNALAGA
jgi:hypothetical protein